MKLEEFLRREKQNILNRWFSLILETYPSDFSDFLKREKDRFSNPVGYAVKKNIAILLEELTLGNSPEIICSALDDIIRIRAVQDFTPSEAVGFVFLLKDAVREAIGTGIANVHSGDGVLMFEALLQFERKVDDLAAMTFDIYVKCRENIDRIKTGKKTPEQALAEHRERIMRKRKQQ